MISKKLLKTVCGFKVQDINIENSIISFYAKDGNHSYGESCNTWLHRDNQGFGHYHYANIYELANKCKEWAMSQGFIILTYGEAYYNVDVHYHSNKSKFGNLAFSETAQEEPQAIFKACQYILDNQDEK